MFLRVFFICSTKAQLKLLIFKINGFQYILIPNFHCFIYNEQKYIPNNSFQTFKNFLSFDKNDLHRKSSHKKLHAICRY